MKLKLIGITGLVFLTINQAMLLKGNAFLQAQTIDFAHWLLLFGAILTISFSFIFPKSIINNIATSLTIIGIIAHIGMATFDFVFWSFGDDYTGMRELIIQLKNKPSIWHPFMTVGPSFLFIGLATQAFKFIRTHPISSIITIGGSIMIGISSFLISNRLIVVLAHIIFALGLMLLIFRRETKIAIKSV